MPPQADEDNVMNCKANSPEANGPLLFLRSTGAQVIRMLLEGQEKEEQRKQMV